MSFNLRKMDKVELRLYSNSEELCSKPSRMTQWKRNQKRLSLPTVHFYILLLKGVRKHRRFTDNPDTPLWLPQRKLSSRLLCFGETGGAVTWLAPPVVWQRLRRRLPLRTVHVARGHERTRSVSRSMPDLVADTPPQWS